VIDVTREIFHTLLGWIRMSTGMNTAQGKSYERFIAYAHSPRHMEAATTTLPLGKHVIKIPTAG